MAIDQLTETSTKEDVQNYVEEVVKEVEADRAGEKPEGKSDAQITSEHANNTPVVEKKSDDETAETKVEAEAGDEESSWIDDETKAEIAALGIPESDIADFTSREELDRALRLFDNSALEAGRKALAETDGEGAERARDDKGKFTKTKETPPAEPAVKQDGRYEIKLKKENGWDEEVIAEFTSMRDHYDAREQALKASYDARLDTLESRFQEADDIAYQRQFDGLVDSIGHADLFGKTDSETAKEKQRREDLFVEVETYLAGRRALGRPTDLNEAIVNRIARSLFAEEFGKKDLKQRTRKISRQSDARQGGGATRPQDPREDPREEADRRYKELSQA